MLVESVIKRCKSILFEPFSVKRISEGYNSKINSPKTVLVNFEYYCLSWPNRYRMPLIYKKIPYYELGLVIGNYLPSPKHYTTAYYPSGCRICLRKVSPKPTLVGTRKRDFHLSLALAGRNQTQYTKTYLPKYAYLIYFGK